MKMELDKKLDTIRLNVLAANFGDLATRRQMIQEFGDYPDALWGVNENGEKVMLSIRKNGITERVFQSNRWVRVNEYDADGCEAGETYEGRWAECPKPTATDTDEELEPGVKCVAKKNVTMNEPHFMGHFPGNPVMPGVLIIEALAQTGAVAILCQDEWKGKTAYFAGINNAKFKQKVVPGDTLELTTEIIKVKGPIGVGKAVARVNGKVACMAELTFAIG